MSADTRRFCALGFCAFSVPAILVLPRLGWLWATLACLLPAAILLLAPRRTSGNAPNFAGKAGMTLLLLWNLVLLGAWTRQLCGIYPGGDALIGILLLLLAVYAASKGVGTVVRVGAICFFFLVIIYGALMGFALPVLQKQWLAPVTRADWRLVPAALVPTLALWLCGDEKKTRALPWMLGGIVLTALAALVTAGNVSPEVAAKQSFPFYTAAKSVSIFGTMERLEPLVSAALTAGGFCLLGLICCVNTKILSRLLPLTEPYPALINFLVGGAFLWLSGLLTGTALAVGTAIFWGIFPLLPPSLGARKKE